MNAYRSTTSDEVFRALSDPTRRAILGWLRQAPRMVSHLAAEFPMTRPAISQHLKILRQAGLVRERKVGRQRHYRLVPSRLAVVDRWIEDYRRFWKGNLESLKRYVEAGSPEAQR